MRHTLWWDSELSLSFHWLPWGLGRDGGLVMLLLCGLGPGAELADVCPVFGGSWWYQSNSGGLTCQSKQPDLVGYVPVYCKGGWTR